MSRLRERHTSGYGGDEARRTVQIVDEKPVLTPMVSLDREPTTGQANFQDICKVRSLRLRQLRSS